MITSKVSAAPLAHLAGQHLGTEEGAEVLQEFLDADVIVIGAPMYNFTIPSQLKAWFDRILVAAGGPSIPPPLVAQLGEGGRMVIPIGSPEDQILTVVERAGGEIRKEAAGECKFVKLVGKYAWET